MTLKEVYTALEGDYEGVLARLMTEKLVAKFALKFVNDKSYENLVKDMETEDWDEAFREAHTLKGVCQNLSFTKLYESSHDICEALRAKEIDKAKELLPRVAADYDQTIAAIGNLE